MDANAQDRLRALVETQTKDERLLSEFMHFHFSVSQKLYSLEYFAVEVAGLQPIETCERLVKSETVKSVEAVDRRDDFIDSKRTCILTVS